MSRDTCEDCGTRRYGRTCPNCSEELFIYETQNEFLPETLSTGFVDKVREQEEKRKQEPRR